MLDWKSVWKRLLVAPLWLLLKMLRFLYLTTVELTYISYLFKKIPDELAEIARQQILEFQLQTSPEIQIKTFPVEIETIWGSFQQQYSVFADSPPPQYASVYLSSA
jgi:hypothetical protein